jgi:CDP-diacylglycerol--serine O-phosphatidyltransferase
MGSGLISIVLSSSGLIVQAASFIFFSIVLDYLDGFLARKLNLSSGFGKELDSLADIISFGVAPILLVWNYLDSEKVLSYWILPILVLQLFAGAFRLARFNLQNPKQGSFEKTLGLTITQSGMVIALAVLSDLSAENFNIPLWIYSLLSLFLSYLMVSKLVFPGPSWYAPTKRSYLIYLTLGAILTYFSSIFTTLLVIYLGGLTFSIGHQIYGFSIRPQV